MPSALQTFSATTLAAFLQADSTNAAAGVMIQRQVLDLVPTLLGCFVGTFLGDVAWIVAGKSLGLAFVDRILERSLGGKDAIRKWTERIHRHAVMVIFMSRFLPGLSMPIHLLIGLVIPNPIRLLLPLAAANVAYVALLVGSSYTIASLAPGATEKMPILSAGWLILSGVIAIILYRVAGLLFARFFVSGKPN